MMKFRCKECGESSEWTLTQVETCARVEVTSGGELFAEWSYDCIPDRIIDHGTLQCPKCKAKGKIELVEEPCTHEWRAVPIFFGDDRVRRVCDLCGKTQTGSTYVVWNE